MTHIEVTDTQDLSLAIGDTVTLRLPQVAGTGFVWTVMEVGDGLAVDEDTDVAPEESAPGAAGEHVLRFSAREAGTWQVVLQLGRQWEPQTAEGRILTVTVT